MKRLSGDVGIHGSLAYCNQQPWILTETIRGNVLFGNSPEDSTRLDTIFDVCALKKDLKEFSRGMDTLIGEKGVNLSGGQKARVALARALYQESDIYILDDPLSALDAHVGQYVFEHAIKDYLFSKTVLLVTHQLHVLQRVDRILVMDQGLIAEDGTYADLMMRNGHLCRLMQHYRIETAPRDKEDETHALEKKKNVSQNSLSQKDKIGKDDSGTSG